MNDIKKIEQLQQAILLLSPTLPELLGGDWLAFSHDLQALLAQLVATTDSAESKHSYDAIRLLFFDYEQANEHLWQVLSKIESEQSDGGKQSLAEKSAVLRGAENGNGATIGGDVNVSGNFVGRDQIIYNTPNPFVTRYSDILIPSRVPVEQRFAIIVGLTCLPTPDSRDAKPLPVKLGRTVTIILTSLDELIVLGERKKEIDVLVGEDSEPVVFYLSAPHPGEHRVQIDFWSKGDEVLSYVHSICAVANTEVVTISQVITQRMELEE